jgi:hypothetical protein
LSHSVKSGSNSLGGSERSGIGVTVDRTPSGPDKRGLPVHLTLGVREALLRRFRGGGVMGRPPLSIRVGCFRRTETFGEAAGVKTWNGDLEFTIFIYLLK